VTYQIADRDTGAVIQPCVCGHYVSAYPTRPSPALLRHYRSEDHRYSMWGMLAAENDASTFIDAYEAQPGRPTAGQPSVDVSGAPPRASAVPAGKP